MTPRPRPVVAILAFLSIGLPFYGQTGLGSITGEVVDPSGAKLPHATLRLIETATQTAFSTAANAEGIFIFPSVAVGHYTLTVTAPGFRDRQIENLDVSAYQQVSLGKLTLEVGGGPVETVTVTANQDLVKDTATRMDAINASQVNDIPLAGRNWVTLLKVVPGANAIASTNNSIAFNGREYTATGYADFRINGKPVGTTQVNLDGGSIVDQGSDAKTTVAPSAESIEEVSVLTNNFQAQYGYRAGNVINVITKSGTNTFHGMGFDDFRNEDLNANSWSNNCVACGTAIPRPKYRYNYVGGNLGGPIKKNKLFFFYNYENFIQTTPTNTTQSRTPTDLERQGDFSQTINPSTGKQQVIYQPGTQLTNGANGIPYPGNIIPASQINPLGTAVMKLFPEPNVAGSLSVNYNFESQLTMPRWDSTGKVDWNISANNRLSGRYTEDGGTEAGPNINITSGNLPNAILKRPRPDRAAAGTFTRTFSPNFVMDALVAYSFDRVDWILVNPSSLSKMTTGLEGLPLTYKPTNDILPAMTFGTYPAFAFPRTPADSYTNEYQFSSNFTWSKGTHIIKFGILHIRNYKNEDDSSGPGAGNDKGTFDFSPNANSPFDTGYGPSNLLLGSLNSFTQTQYIAHKDAAYEDTDFYIQDTWKIRHNLTLDYGVRMYHMPSQHELNPANTNDATFVPSLWNAASAPRLYVLDPASPKQVIDPANPNNPLPATLTNILKYTIVPGSGNPRDGVAAFGTNGIGNAGILDPKSILFAPRGGFAWSPGSSDKTVIRGGFGWGYNRPNIAQALNAFENGNAGQTSIVLTSLSTLQNSANVSPIGILSLGATDTSSRKVPTIYDYSMSVQRVLPGQMVLDVAYVGNLQRHQPIQFNLNAVPLGAAYNSRYIDPSNPGSNFAGTVSASNPNPLPGSNAADPSIMRPYPGYNSLTMNENSGNAHYNSMQVTVGKRLSHGLSFQAAYTLAKTAGNLENQGLFSSNWQQYTGYVLANDRRHVFNASYSYDVPKFSHILHFDNGFGRRVLDDWRFAGVFTAFSGAPYSPSFSIQQATSTTSVSLGNIFLGTPDLTPRLQVTGSPNNASAPLYFDATGLGLPGLATTGVGPRNFLNGLGSFTNDMSLIKTIRVKEKYGFELRINAFNPFNQVRRINTNTSIQYKANGPNFSDGFTIINTGAQLAANQVAAGKPAFQGYINGEGLVSLTNVQPMRIVELGLRFRF
ncbi:MAG TPA: carboxypeptidase regulatory-like domain-containing protein [Bryobacteraceae bacterium]|nr:carboxypeptidase regulatory-like domain-containing protein [Bryobacteraceae bacterium]